MALELSQRGYDARNLHALLGGLDAWEKVGYPIGVSEAAPKVSATVPEATTSSETSTSPDASRPSGEIQRIGPAEAKALLDGGEALLYDARARSAYDAKHAVGALPLPGGELDALIGEVPKDKLLILYCT